MFLIQQAVVFLLVVVLYPLQKVNLQMVVVTTVTILTGLLMSLEKIGNTIQNTITYT